LAGEKVGCLEKFEKLERGGSDKVERAYLVSKSTIPLQQNLLGDKT